MKGEKIAILGGGNGAQTIAADLTLSGFEVNLFELPAFQANISVVLERGGVELTGIKEGFAKIRMITTDIKSAIKDVEMIMVIGPAFAHKAMAEACAAYLQDGQMVVLNPGSTGGALEFVQILKELGVKKKVTLAETTMLTHVCRIVSPGKVWLTHSVKKIHLAAFPAKDTSRVLEKFRTICPVTLPFSDVLETSINNVNPVIHNGAAILNAARIEFSKGDFYFFREGLTPSVAKVHEALDEDRMALADRFGYPRVSTVDYMADLGYTQSQKSFFEAIHTSEMFCGKWAFKAPSNLQHRFITEDIGYNLVTWVTLADIFGVQVPTMRALIHLTSILNGVDYLKEGKRTAQTLGVSKMNMKELKEFLNEGQP